ncbi:MAG: hypothetical protein KDD61_04500 [Bdellovibrionales bacterium]|nr:hypothetical protein [Bdellovibrionales bacterium]
MQWIKDNTWEINQSKGLRYLGLVLSLIHIITFFQWNSLYSTPDTGTQIVCWSFFEKCKEAAFVTGNGGALYTYLGLAALSAFLFLLGPALTSRAWGLLATTFFLKLSIYLFDYRLYSNTHTLVFLVELAFLLVPNKRNLFKSLILVYFLTSGLFKLNTAWLTGFAFEPLHFAPKVNEWLAVLSLIAELTLPFFLLARKMKHIFIGVISLTIYHFLMGSFEGYFHLFIMTLLLVLFPVLNQEIHNEEQGYTFNSYLRPSPSKLWPPIGILVFLGLQALPFFLKLEWPTTPFELIRPSLPEECQQKSVAIYTSSTKILPNLLENVEQHTSCKTHIRLAALKDKCHELSQEKDFVTIYSSFVRRNFSESHFQTVFEMTDACGRTQK